MIAPLPPRSRIGYPLAAREFGCAPSARRGNAAAEGASSSPLAEDGAALPEILAAGLETPPRAAHVNHLGAIVAANDHRSVGRTRPVYGARGRPAQSLAPSGGRAGLARSAPAGGEGGSS